MQSQSRGLVGAAGEAGWQLCSLSLASCLQADSACSIFGRLGEETIKRLIALAYNFSACEESDFGISVAIAIKMSDLL